MSDKPSSDALERNEASPVADEDLVVVRYKFGLPQAVAVVFVMLILAAVWTAPRGPVVSEPPLPAEGAHGRLLGGEVVTQADVERLRDILARPARGARTTTAEETIKVDPRVDEAFNALDRSSVKQLRGFLTRYRDDAYAKAQGYIAQVEEWHQDARWRAEDDRARRQLNSVEWSYD
jgi:hypothetical protein